MRVAALYDIHGNLPALEAVLQTIAQQAVDLLVIGGDVVAGPMPRETLACLRELTLPVSFLHGNADREVLAQAAGEDAGAVPEAVRELVQWVSQQLLPADLALIAGWPATVTVTMPVLGTVLFCHATPWNDTEVFTRLTPEKRLLSVFAELEAAVVVCGHTHMQFDRMIGTTRVVNAGSVGMPYGIPGADWLLLGEELEFRHTPYDGSAAAQRIRATTYPQAEPFAAQNVLQVPTAAQALDVFTKMEPADDYATSPVGRRYLRR